MLKKSWTLNKGRCFVVPTTVTVHNALFLFLTSCNVPGRYQCLGGTCCFHLRANQPGRYQCLGGTCCFHLRANHENKGSMFLLNTGKNLLDHRTVITQNITIRKLMPYVVKVKVKFTLEQVTKAHRGSIGTTLLLFFLPRR